MMYKSLKRNNDKFAKENKFSYPAPVIRRRYSLQEVPRRRIHKAIAKAMSICVAFGNKVMDTRLPLPVGSSDKYDNGVQCGRSMIEMLGVLAIVAVLSVGGIAGYYKAMNKFKINKLISGYTYIIRGIIEHLNEFINPQLTDDNGMVPLVEAYGLIPQNWTILNTHYLKDNDGNRVHIFQRSGTITFSFGLDSPSIRGANRENYCIAVFQQIIQPLHSIISVAYPLYYTNDNRTPISYSLYGDKSCRGNKNCLKSVSIGDFEKVCSICKNQEECSIVIDF